MSTLQTVALSAFEPTCAGSVVLLVLNLLLVQLALDVWAWLRSVAAVAPPQPPAAARAA